MIISNNMILWLLQLTCYENELSVVLHDIIVVTVYAFSIPSAKQSQPGWSLARRRWLVAYTLMRNPSLQELTASRLQCRTMSQSGIHGDEKLVNHVHM